MLLNLLAGLPIMLICLILQAGLLGYCVRSYASFRARQAEQHHLLVDILLLALVMLLMLLANFLQMAAWAGLFMLIGEFDEFTTALYYSAVNFATLGYGDIVMSAQWRLPGPIEAANGVLMFDVSTAGMTAAVADMLRRNQLLLQERGTQQDPLSRR